MEKKRRIGGLIQVLAEDCDRAFEELAAIINAGKVRESALIDAEYAYKARQLIRTVFAYLEAIAFSVKDSTALRRSESANDVPWPDSSTSAETLGTTNLAELDAGSDAGVSLADKIRFAVALSRKTHGVDPPFDESAEWWICFIEAIKIHERLSHPKMPWDLDISGDDLLNVLRSTNGFEKELLHFGGDNITWRDQ